MLIEESAGEAVAAAAFENDDPCWFFFTSGTMGHPKAVVLTQGQSGFVVTNHIAGLMPGLRPQSASSLSSFKSHVELQLCCPPANGSTLIKFSGSSRTIASPTCSRWQRSSKGWSTTHPSIGMTIRAASTSAMPARPSIEPTRGMSRASSFVLRRTYDPETNMPLLQPFKESPDA
jgi:acyl-coenzyme A synthetase/AMP-(fatty) acid ligase